MIKEPRITTSKKNCHCTETGQEIRKGERVLITYSLKTYPDDNIKTIINVYCRGSNSFQEFCDNLKKKANGAV